MKVTFKQFKTFVEADENATDEQLNEIFGAFFGHSPDDSINKKRLEALKAKREALKKAEEDKKKQIALKKASMLASTDKELDIKKASFSDLNKIPNSQMRGAQLRAIDRNPFADND